jgi:hypothetical protein
MDGYSSHSAVLSMMKLCYKHNFKFSFLLLHPFLFRVTCRDVRVFLDLKTEISRPIWPYPKLNPTKSETCLQNTRISVLLILFPSAAIWDQYMSRVGPPQNASVLMQRSAVLQWWLWWLQSLQTITPLLKCRVSRTFPSAPSLTTAVQQSWRPRNTLSFAQTTSLLRVLGGCTPQPGSLRAHLMCVLAINTTPRRSQRYYRCNSAATARRS